VKRREVRTVRRENTVHKSLKCNLVAHKKSERNNELRNKKKRKKKKE